MNEYKDFDILYIPTQIIDAYNESKENEQQHE